MDGGVVRDHNNVNLADLIELVEYDPIWVHRGKAIQAYAELENSLNRLFSALSDTTWETAATIFYKIINTDARRSIIEKLLHQKCGAKFNPFWNQLTRELRDIDGRRNEIAHWLAAVVHMINSQQHLLLGVILIPAASVANHRIEPRLTTSDLIRFRKKCEDLERLAGGLAARIKPPHPDMPTPSDEPSLDIYQQPLVYPLPEDHPLNGPPEAPRTHPQSFPPSLRFLRAAAGSPHLEVWRPQAEHKLIGIVDPTQN